MAPITKPTLGNTGWNTAVDAVIDTINALPTVAISGAYSDLLNPPAYFGSQRNVRDYGAVGNGTTNDTTAIQNALNATPAGAICWLPPGNYLINAPLVVPPGVTFQGSHSETLWYTGATPISTSIRVAAGFTGVAAIRLLGKTAGGYATTPVGQRIRDITIDGSAGPANIKGVQLFGFVREATLERVTARAMTDQGFAADVDSAATAEQSTSPQSLRFVGCVADNCMGTGFSFLNVPDTTLYDCNAQGCGYIGFYLAGMPNSMVIGCRSEWSTQYGFYITSGYWGTGQGSGGIDLFGCLTDRNGYDGVMVDATGNSPIGLTGCMHRRDGRTGGTTYTAVRALNTTMPLVLDGMKVYPGVNDDGTGNNTPYAGVSATGSTSVVVTSGYIHAVTTAVVDGGTNGAFVVMPNVGRATGTSAAPVRTAPALPVLTSQRAPLGGVVSITYAATITPNAATSSQGRVIATGAMTINPPTNASDGQSYTLQVQANGGAFAITMAAAIVLTTNMTRALTVASGAYGLFQMRYSAQQGAWVLLGQTQTIAG